MLLGMEHFVTYGQESRMCHESTMANIGLFGKEVLPVIKDWWGASVDSGWQRTRIHF